MQDDEIQATPLAQLWLEELGATVPEAYHGEPARRRRRPDELVCEDLATASRAPKLTRPGARA